VRASVVGGNLEELLAHAVANDQLVLHYQPVVDTISMEVRYHEALVRWASERGLVQPGDFIPVAERSDLICDVDAWVLGEATRQASVWGRMDLGPEPVVAVNISARRLETRRAVTDVVTSLERHGLGAHQLVLEITETASVSDGQALENLHVLRDLGVRLSLDDLGTGYSTADQLSRLPLDIAKIASCHVARGTTSAYERLAGMVSQCHDLGLVVVGEGVERAEQLAVLRELQVEYAQGFLLGRPVPAAEIEERVAVLAAVTVQHLSQVPF